MRMHIASSKLYVHAYRLTTVLYDTYRRICNTKSYQMQAANTTPHSVQLTRGVCVAGA